MFELLLCSSLTILPDFLFRRFVQGKRLGREITLFSVWFELRWGITLCLILTLSLITTIFYFHPSTKAATSVFRTVTILPETNGRVAETFVDINQRVEAGQPLFRLDSTAQEAAVETARRKIAETEAAMVVAKSQLAEAEGRIVQARGALQQAEDELKARAEVQRRSPARSPSATSSGCGCRSIPRRAPSTPPWRAARPSCRRWSSSSPPRGQAPTRRCVRPRSPSRRPWSWRGPTGILQQFALRPGDVVNPMLRPAGILVPERKVTALLAGFGQIESQVLKVGMIGEVTCVAKPWVIVPVVVTEVQNVIASGQVRPTDTLVDIQQLARPGTITVILEPLYPGQLDDLPQGGSCIANAYTNNHEALQDPATGTLRRFGLHAIDAIGLVHAMILRIQALLLPLQTLVLGGH